MTRLTIEYAVSTSEYRHTCVVNCEDTRAAIIEAVREADPYMAECTITIHRVERALPDDDD